jgi:uncharacterized protein
LPPWAGEVALVLDEPGGEPRTVARASAGVPGRASVERVWRPGDELRVDLPVRPRWTYPDPRIDAVRGCVAVERGPLVYCAEAPAADPAALAGDALAARLALVAVDDTSEPADLAEPALDGAVAVGVTARDRPSAADRGTPYRADPPAADLGRTRVEPLVPYFSWGHHGPAAMRVWLPVERNATDISDG